MLQTKSVCCRFTSITCKPIFLVRANFRL